ncbi:MAG: SDR family oxidoreductase, partial [Gammaproteobacteria bacterium]|nr:SDR family oxidoreductase [Gammaproteobacteria bacterium]
MGFLTGKRALIVGVAGERSIAWGVAKAMYREGAEIAYTYQNDKLKSRVEKLGAQTKSGRWVVLRLEPKPRHRQIFAHAHEKNRMWVGTEDQRIVTHTVRTDDQWTRECLGPRAVGEEGLASAEQHPTWTRTREQEGDAPVPASQRMVERS